MINLLLLRYSKLEELYLADNSVKTLTSMMPKVFPEIQILDVRSNKIHNHEELVSIKDTMILFINTLQSYVIHRLLHGETYIGLLLFRSHCQRILYC